MKRPSIRTVEPAPAPSRETLERMRAIAAEYGCPLVQQDMHGLSFRLRRRNYLLAIVLRDQATSAELAYRDTDGDDIVLQMERNEEKGKWFAHRGAPPEPQWDELLPLRKDLPPNEFRPLPDPETWEAEFRRICHAFAVLSAHP